MAHELAVSLQQAGRIQDPEANCLPAGIQRGSPYPWRIVQTPTHYFILYEGNVQLPADFHEREAPR
jgi:hypothetical protein